MFKIQIINQIQYEKCEYEFLTFKTLNPCENSAWKKNGKDTFDESDDNEEDWENNLEE